MATSQDFVNWICGPELDPAFLMWLLRASRKFIRSVSTGAIHQTVYVDVVNRFEVCLPNLTTQRAIAARMDECFTHVEELRRNLAEQSEAISALPGAYLAEAFGNPVSIA
jgi:type I restriction enzyme S subunit